MESRNEHVECLELHQRETFHVIVSFIARSLLSLDVVRHDLTCNVPEHSGSVVPSIAERGIRGESLCLGKLSCVGRGRISAEIMEDSRPIKHSNDYNTDNDYDGHHHCRLGGVGSVSMTSRRGGTWCRDAAACAMASPVMCMSTSRVGPLTPTTSTTADSERRQ